MHLCWLPPPAFCFTFDAKFVVKMLLLRVVRCVSGWTNGPCSLCFAQRLRFYALDASLEKRMEKKKLSRLSWGLFFSR